MSETSLSYRDGAKAGISSSTLQTSLKGLQDRFGKGAMQQWAELDDTNLRKRAKESRMKTLEHLDIILAELAKNVRQRGGHVYFAESAQDAVDYTIEVARKRGVKRVIKGKSMTSIEIGIDQPLEDEGIEVVETDLGEYIVQIAEDTPSHIIAPCVHMDRNQIGELFADKLGIDYTNDPPSLTKAARKVLREKLLSADMGITGCNLACAETGHVSLVSNEGNIRMSTTMVPVHVALMGMERVVPTLEDHRDALQLLCQGAIAKKISTYVSFLGGPKIENDPDGPEEFHLVIIDNGRSKILADPEFREVLACIRCGACLNICPVYGKIGGHAYNSTYCGPIGAVITPLLDGVNKHADLCKGETLCGACKDICPVENDLPRMLGGLREKLAYGSDRWDTRPINPKEGYGYKVWQVIVSNSVLYRMGIKLGRLIQRPFIDKDRMIRKLGKLASGWTEDRDLPPLSRRTFTEIYATRKTAIQAPPPVEPEGDK